MNSALVLIVEDDPDIARVLDAYLQREGFRTVRAADGEVALQHHLSLRPDLVLLDANLPKLDGFSVLAEMRRRGETPVIFVTALAEDVDKLSALRSGADDYVVKPFNPVEVVARVKVVLKRVMGGAERQVLRVAPLELDLGAHVARIYNGADAEVLALTLSEFRLLAHLMRAPTQVFSRAELIDACLPESEALERTVDSHISNLRRKLQNAGVDGLACGVRGVGYRLLDLP
jgi:two-component system, OmpR family, response regulator AdeR